MRTLHAPKWCGVLALVAAGLAGCADSSSTAGGPPRVAVSGTVTLNGKPLPHGVVQFDPEATDKGVIAVGKVEDGHFSIEEGQGPVPGKYHVVISSKQPVEIQADQEPGPTPPPEPEKVPARYNTKSTLTQEVTADGPNAFEFALSGQ